MTREKAILVLDSLSTWLGYERPITIEIVEAIKTLSQPSLPSDLDEAAVEFSKDVASGHIYKDLCVGFKAGAEWMAEQGVSMQIMDDTEWEEVDSFIHKNVDGSSIIQIRKK